MSDDRLEISFDDEQAEKGNAAEERLVITADDLHDEPPASAILPSPARTPYEAGVFVAAPVRYAGFWLRLVALLIDGIILNAAFAVIGLLCYLFIRLPHHLHFPQLLAIAGGDSVIIILISWMYLALCESSSWQATPGKIALGLKVTDLLGRRISFGRATGRYFGKYLAALILCIGFIMAAFTAKKQGLHDRMACCLVVKC